VTARRPIRTIAVVMAASDRQADGIRDHTERLVASLRRSGTTVHVLVRPHATWATRLTRADAGAPLRLRELDAIVVQYNPFWYGRRGFAPGLPVALLGLAIRARTATLGLIVHENYIDARDWRTFAMSAWQRLQLLALQALSDVSFGTIVEYTRLLRRSWPCRPAHHLPVGSNFPDGRGARAAGRERLGARDGTFVCAVFGLAHPGRLEGHVMAAVDAVAATGRDVILINLGSGEARAEKRASGAEIRSLGFLADTEITGLIAASDIFLASYADGVSTRRGTVMVALQHGVAVVGTEGHLTDAMLRNAREALRLTPVDDTAAFAAAVRELATDATERSRLGAAGRALYESAFDWSRIAERLLTLLAEPRR
jgi:glycosyltransferase involved in cell wall biosynthesis